MPSKSNKKSHTSKRSGQSASLNGKRAREASTEPTYVVEKILNKKKIDGVWKYRVKWEGYSYEECTWEPLKHLEAVKDLVSEFNRKLKEQDKSEDEEEKKHEKEVSEEESEESEEEKEEEEEDKKPVRRPNNKGKVSKAKSSKSKASVDKNHSAKADNKSATKKNMESPYKKVKTDKEPDEPEPVKKTIYGHFKLGDKPHKIINARKECEEMIFTIEWEPRLGGKVPLNTEMTGLELRKYDKDLLLDFYEDRLRFVKPTPKNSMTKSVVKQKPEELIDEDLNKQNEQKMKEEETNTTTYREIRSEVGGNDFPEHNPETKKIQVLNIIDLEDSPQEIKHEEMEEVKSPNEVDDTDKSDIDEVEEVEKTDLQPEKKKDVFEAENIIDNKGQPIFADVGYNATDAVRDLALDEHLRVVSQSHQDLSKPETQTNGIVTQEKPEPIDLQLDSPKEISDIGSEESSGLDNI